MNKDILQKVTDMKEYVHQTIGSTASLVKVIAFLSTLFAFGTASLMLIMFLHMLKQKIPVETIC
ncbi:hypothetical protein ACEQPO_29655 [Bacillus sp. SL00103]